MTRWHTTKGSYPMAVSLKDLYGMSEETEHMTWSEMWDLVWQIALTWVFSAYLWLFGAEMEKDVLCEDGLWRFHSVRIYPGWMIWERRLQFWIDDQCDGMNEHHESVWKLICHDPLQLLN